MLSRIFELGSMLVLECIRMVENMNELVQNIFIFS